MRLLKTHVLLRFLNSYVVDSPEPANISYLWNFGSLLGVCLIIQILTGAFLAMHYTPNVDFAFNSVEHIMRDVNNGWIIRYTHANVASFFFIFLYMHIGRGLYYSSYKSPRVLVWSIGVIILVLTIAIAFLGYVLPYGQMSLWGATVITNLLSAIPIFGQDIVELIWGGFSVSNATLNRFFSLHYLLPFVLAALAIAHLIALHVNGLEKGPKYVYNIIYFFNRYLSTINIKNNLAFILPRFKAKNRIGPHDKEIISILVGSLLGDCHGEKLLNGGVRFKFKQSVIHKEYLFYLFEKINKLGYTNNTLPYLIKNKFKDKTFESYCFNTYSFTSLV